MILKDISAEEFCSEVIQNNYNIIVYGYGVIGKIVAPYFLKKYNLQEKVLFFVDADKHKQGYKDDVFLGSIQVREPEKMLDVNKKIVILVTGSRCKGIIEYIEKQPRFLNTNVYLLPLMLEKESRKSEKISPYRISEEQLIPKKIHYCWFGGAAMSPEMQKCLESWQRFCPDYEIIRWDETNYDIKKYKFTQQAYELKKWAFLSDMARLDILYENGGIYLDTDVELIRNLDDMLYQPGFCGIEKWGVLNSGGGCGAIRHNSMIAEMLEFRKQISLLYLDDCSNMESSGYYESVPFIRLGYVPNNTLQVVRDMVIYPSDVFHPYDYMTKKCIISENTYSIHHFSESWVK